MKKGIQIGSKARTNIVDLSDEQLGAVAGGGGKGIVVIIEVCKVQKTSETTYPGSYHAPGTTDNQTDTTTD